MPSQKLKSPATRTPWALGAHTVNRVPATPCVRHRLRAERLPQLLVPALADQMQVELAEGGQEAVRVVDLDARRRRTTPAACTPAARASGSTAGEQAVAVVETERRCASPSITTLTASANGRSARKSDAARHRVRAQQRVRVVVRARAATAAGSRGSRAARPWPDGASRGRGAAPASAVRRRPVGLGRSSSARGRGGVGTGRASRGGLLSLLGRRDGRSPPWVRGASRDGDGPRTALRTRPCRSRTRAAGRASCAGPAGPGRVARAVGVPAAPRPLRRARGGAWRAA